jgi:hypothetical protein
MPEMSISVFPDFSGNPEKSASFRSCDHRNVMIERRNMLCDNDLRSILVVWAVLAHGIRPCGSR